MGFGDVMKNGWHPDGKGGGKESWRKDFKGVNQVAGWMGKGKSDSTDLNAAHSNASKPISALQDPSKFGLPPKHRDFYGEDAAAASIPVAPTHPQANGSAAASRAPPPLATTAVARPTPSVPERARQPEREESPEKPSGPFKVDTTGLSTTNLPPPPQRHEKRSVGTATPPRVAAHIGSPARTASPARAHPPPPPSRANVAVPAATTKPKPSLPPRVPPRGAFPSSAAANIPNTPPPAYTERDAAAPGIQPGGNELQERLARMRARIDNAEAEQAGSSAGSSATGVESVPPPLPLSSKPR